MENEQKINEQLTVKVEECREVLAQQHNIIREQRDEIDQLKHKYEAVRRALRELLWDSNYDE